MLPKMGDLYPGSIIAPGAQEEEGEASWHCAVLDEATELIAKPTGSRSRNLEELGHSAQFLVLIPESGSDIHPIDAGARWPGMEFEVVNVIPPEKEREGRQGRRREDMSREDVSDVVSDDDSTPAGGLTVSQMSLVVGGAMGNHLMNQRATRQVLAEIMLGSSVV